MENVGFRLKTYDFVKNVFWQLFKQFWKKNRKKVIMLRE